MTAHAAQGQTFKQGVIVDLSIGGGTSPLSSYVALTRVQRREDMLILRPFDIAPYQKKDERKGRTYCCARCAEKNWTGRR